MIKRLLFLLLPLWVLLSPACQQNQPDNVSAAQNQSGRNSDQEQSPQPAGKPQKGKSSQNANGIPAYVLDVLNYVQKHNNAPDGYVGGREFENREKRLPKTDSNGGKIKYREWDVFPKKKGQNRGAERLITGSDQNAYYTKDHYKSFVNVKTGVKVRK